MATLLFAPQPLAYARGSVPAPRLFGSRLNAMLRLHVVRRVAACNHIAIYLLPDASKRYARLRPRRAETNPPPFAVHLNF